MNWTKELPAVSGFYWYRDQPSSKPEPVEWDKSDRTAFRCGTDVMLWAGGDITEPRFRLDGEFWPARIEPPPVEGTGP